MKCPRCLRQNIRAVEYELLPRDRVCQECAFVW